MPNIEIHGETFAPTIAKGAIAKRLHGTMFAKDVIVTTYKDVSADLAGSYRPYLRVVCTDATEAQQVADLLKPLNIDIEVLLLHSFIPAK